MYFRPVSVTLQCVMALTIGSLIVYTLLSISRNSDELSGEFTPTTLTQTLTIGSRVAAFAPMMCMLFVGCRMYVLATTEGLGEPPAWVKKCMWTAVTGMALQFLLVVLIPLYTRKKAPDFFKEEAMYDMTEGHAKEIEAKKAKKAAERAAKEKEAAEKAKEEEEPDPTPLQELTGDQNDVHPALGNIEYEENKSYMKVPFWILQFISILCLYGGLSGVIYGIVTFPVGTTQISPAVKCTIAMSALYFFVCLLLWLGRALPVSDGFTHAALAMSSVVRKAPMFSVLFLASRMRALQLDPPLGMPPLWMQRCFFAITALIFVETLVAGIIGATGKMKKGYYGVYLFESSTVFHLVQHLSAIITYLALFPVINGVYSMTWPDGSEAPLSTTLRCVVTFEAVYFGVLFVQSLALFAEEVNGVEYTILRDSTVSAGISLGLAPLLCILFVATRMRALQITQQQGDPPGWAQDCMLIAVFATCVQAFCCLVMPIFIGSACQVDEDGNPDYDLEPMVGAYAVAVVKYVALIALHGSVMLVCYSVWAMTPETAHSGNRIIESWAALSKGLFITLCIFFVALLFSSAKVIGMGIKMAIEACDETLLGVEITVKKVALNLFKGYVEIKDLKVHNPEDEIVYKKNEKGKLVGTPTGKKCEWKDDYIAKIHLVLLKINVGRIISSRGKEFELQNLSIVGIHVNVEKPNTDLKEKNSNIEYIMNHLDALGLIPPEEEPDKSKVEPPKKEEPKKEEPKKKEDAKDKPKPGVDVPRIVLHKIAIGDIGAGVTIRGVRVLGQISFHPTIKGIDFPDIQRDVFGGREDLSGGETVACLIKAISKKIFQSVVHDIPVELAKASKAAASGAASGVKRAVSGAIGGAARAVGNFVRKRTGSSGSLGDQSPRSPEAEPGSPMASPMSPK